MTRDVIGRPAHAYTRELIADTPTLAGLMAAATDPATRNVAPRQGT